MTLPLSVSLLLVFIYEYIFNFTEYILFEQWYNWIVCSNNCWSFWRNTLSSGIGDFDGTVYDQGLAEFCLIMTLPLSVFDRAKIYWSVSVRIPLLLWFLCSYIFIFGSINIFRGLHHTFWVSRYIKSFSSWMISCFCHWFLTDFQGVPSRTGSPRVLGI